MNNPMNSQPLQPPRVTGLPFPLYLCSVSSGQFDCREGMKVEWTGGKGGVIILFSAADLSNVLQ